MIKEAFEKSPYVAVYGTLKRGFWNHSFIQVCEFIGKGITENRYKLFDVGFPYAIPSEKGYPLEVEIYKLDTPNRLKVLDILEGYPHHYLRRLENILIPQKGKVKAWIYYAKRPEGREYLKLKEVNGLLILTWEG